MALSLLAVINGYFLGVLPLAVASVLAAIVIAIVVEIVIEYIRKKKFIFSKSPVISGLIIGSIVQIGSFEQIALAAVLAILSKKLITFKKMPVFNPAASGLFVTFFLSGGTGEVWWANGTGLLLPTIAIVIAGMVVSWKIKKLYITFTSLVVFSASVVLTQGPAALVFFPFFSAFFMLTEPKTSPNTRNHQIVFGALVFPLGIVFTMLGILSPFILGLLVANLVGKLFLK
ncbi:MAG TPA: hypothetical protein VJH24_04300 [Candidatus Bilamarchaeaceae archaeon]|nr:hypothetical protein [Candidatus Bilamarchaeaceae archaeon]